MKKLEVGKAVFWCVVFFVMLGVVGTMERNDQVAIEEFKREFVVVTDDQDEPQIVSRKGNPEEREFFDFEAKELQHDSKTALR